MSDRILNIINELIEVAIYKTPPGPKSFKIGHRNTEEKERERHQRQTPEYQRWLKKYQQKRKSLTYRPDRTTSKAAEKSARFKRNH